MPSAEVWFQQKVLVPQIGIAKAFGFDEVLAGDERDVAQSPLAEIHDESVFRFTADPSGFAFEVGQVLVTRSIALEVRRRF